MFKYDFIAIFKPINYDMQNCKALDYCQKELPNVQECIRVFLMLLLHYKTYVSDEKALHHFQARLWDEIKT